MLKTCETTLQFDSVQMEQRKFMISLVTKIAGLALLVPLSAEAASFDCTSNKLSDVEEMICSSEVLSALDDALFSQYKLTKKQVDDRDLKQDQVNWINREQKECQSEDCLVSIYLDRLNTLRFWNEQVDVDEERLTAYASEHKVPIYSGNETWEYADVVNELFFLPNMGALNETGVDIKIVTTNGHSCSINGIGTIDGSSVLLNKDYGGTALAENCSLRLEFRVGQIEIKDEDFNCKSSNYCGMRASFDGWVFTNYDEETPQ